MHIILKNKWMNIAVWTATRKFNSHITFPWKISDLPLEVLIFGQMVYTHFLNNDQRKNVFDF